MAKLFSLVLLLCLAVFCSAYRLQKHDMEMFRDDEQEQRLELFSADEDDEPEAISNTQRLLDAVMLDQVVIKGGNVEWFFRKGDVLECVNGEKTINPRCRWTGLVMGPGEKEPKKEKLQVIGKYCNKAGLTKPAPKTIGC